jgi:DNA repair exonuclease SbcCD ATPase subunit
VISLEQVRVLEGRVEKAVAYISKLREEGAELGRRLAEAQSFIDDAANELAAAEEKTQAAERRAEAAEALRRSEAEQVREVESRLSDMAERVAAAETKAAELSARAEEYKKDQAKIEEGIVHALEKLDSFEDLVLAQGSPEPAPEPGKGAGAESAAAESPAAQSAAAERKASAKPGTGLRDAGIAVKSAPDAEGKEPSGPGAGEALGNELDIF